MKILIVLSLFVPTSAMAANWAGYCTTTMFGEYVPKQNDKYEDVLDEIHESEKHLIGKTIRVTKNEELRAGHGRLSFIEGKLIDFEVTGTCGNCVKYKLQVGSEIETVTLFGIKSLKTLKSKRTVVTK